MLPKAWENVDIIQIQMAPITESAGVTLGRHLIVRFRFEVAVLSRSGVQYSRGSSSRPSYPALGFCLAGTLMVVSGCAGWTSRHYCTPWFALLFSLCVRFKKNNNDNMNMSNRKHSVFCALVLGPCTLLWYWFDCKKKQHKNNKNSVRYWT